MTKKEKPALEQFADLRKKLLFYKVSFLILIIIVTVLIYQSSPLKFRGLFPPSGKTSVKSALPYSAEITDILRPLEYSAFQAMMRPEVSLEIDFAGRTWTLRNFYEYDKQGNVLLDEGRYGVCAALASHVSEKLKLLLKTPYRIQFARVAEPGFFSAPAASHIILLMTNEATRKTYYIDPSFGKYGRKSEFDKYLLHDTKNALSPFEHRSLDISFSVDQGLPVLIQEDSLISFTVESLSGKFDRNNFLISLAVTRRNELPGTVFFIIRKQDGRIEMFEQKRLLEQMPSQEKMKALCNRLVVWFKQMEKQLPGPAEPSKVTS